MRRGWDEEYRAVLVSLRDAAVPIAVVHRQQTGLIENFNNAHVAHAGATVLRDEPQVYEAVSVEPILLLSRVAHVGQHFAARKECHPGRHRQRLAGCLYLCWHMDDVERLYGVRSDPA